jgi:hypothetical protein
VITLTLVTKTVFRTVGRSGLPGGKALRLVLDGCGEDGPSRVGIMVGEPEGMDQPVIHEGEPVAWISAGVTEATTGVSWTSKRHTRARPRVWVSPSGCPMRDGIPALMGTSRGVS